MNDIVMRLKDHYADKDTDAWMSCVDAAAEIERLRAALLKAADDLDSWGGYVAANNARAALEGRT